MQITSQSISEVKNATMLNTQAIAKLEVQMGQMVIWVREKGESSLVSPCPIQTSSSIGESSSNVKNKIDY